MSSIDDLLLWMIGKNFILLEVKDKYILAAPKVNMFVLILLWFCDKILDNTNLAHQPSATN